MDVSSLLVTGAAGGLGAGIALELAREGCVVGVLDIAAKEEALAEVAEQVDDAFRASKLAESPFAKALRRSAGLALPADVTDSDAMHQAVARVVAEFGYLHIAVANAGVNRRGLFTADADAPGGPSDFRETLDVCLHGTAHTLYHAARQMKKQGTPGRCIATGSIMGDCVLGRHSAAYSAAKAGIPHMMRVLAGELGEYGITCNTVQPGWCDTPGERAFATEEEIAAFGRRIPAGRIGLPEDVAKAVAFLASNNASYITGATLRVDGGFTSGMEVQPKPWAQGDNISIKSS